MKIKKYLDIIKVIRLNRRRGIQKTKKIDIQIKMNPQMKADKMRHPFKTI
jgi:hypothetical protein